LPAKSNQLLAATEAWKAVQSLAPNGSPEQKMALESLGLIYARGGPSQEQPMVAVFRKLLEQFPDSELRAMAAFSVGDSLFKKHDFAGAEPYLGKGPQLGRQDLDATRHATAGAQRVRNER